MAIITLQGDSELRKGIHYELDMAMEPIGLGGMGKVYKGFKIDERTGVPQPVAIKFMYDDLPPNAYERARREASIQLRNDNLIEMLGFLETQEVDSIGVVKKHYHVISELLEGVSLSDLLEGKTTDGNGVVIPYAEKLLHEYRNDPVHFAKTIAINVVSGLMALHDAGYIHRDIDPSNIMVTNKGQIKIIDFGIAKQMNTLTTGDKSLTVAGKFMGKPEYAAPELVLGDIQHQNQTTDIYAVGILLYHCVTGHNPFEGPRHLILQKQLKEKMPLSVIKNKKLRNVISKACAKRPELRFQTSAQMRVALEEITQTAKVPLLKKSIWLVMGLSVVLIVVALAFMQISRNRERQKLVEEQEKHALFVKEREGFERVVRSEFEVVNRQFEALLADSTIENDAMASLLFGVYKEFDSIGRKVEEDTLYHLSFPEITHRKEEVMKALSEVCQRMRDQALKIRALDQDEEMAEILEQEADSLAVVLTQLK